MSFILLSQSSDFIHSRSSVTYMQLYKGLQKKYTKGYNTVYNKCVQISLNMYVNKKNILKMKKKHKAQNQFARTRVRDE